MRLAFVFAAVILAAGAAAAGLLPSNFGWAGLTREDGKITGAPLTVGSVAEYTGPFLAKFTVGVQGEIMDRSARIVPALPIRMDGDEGYRATEYVGIASAHYEAKDVYCLGRRTDDPCAPWTARDWSVQGAPAIWGAAALAGRTFRIGETWTVSGECMYCEGPRSIAIKAPTSDSPEGTTYTATYSSSMPAPLLWDASLTLHMGEHAFPLKVVYGGGKTFELVSYKAGSTPIAFEHRGTTYPVLVAAVNWTDLPPEGSPPQGVPALSEAIVDQGVPGGIEAGRLSLVMYRPSSASMDLQSEEVARRRSHSWELSVALSPQEGRLTIYEQEVTSSRLVPAPVEIPHPWNRVETPTEGATACVTPVPPLWDQARAMEALSLVGVVTVVHWSFACDFPKLTLFGSPSDEGEQLGTDTLPSVAIDQRTVTLSSQFFRSVAP